MRSNNVETAVNVKNESLVSPGVIFVKKGKSLQVATALVKVKRQQHQTRHSQWQFLWN